MQRAIIGAVREHGSLTTGELVEFVGASESSVRRAARRLEAEGTVVIDQVVIERDVPFPHDPILGMLNLYWVNRVALPRDTEEAPDPPPVER